MRYFKNIDGSFDIVNGHEILFHYANGKMKIVGRINKQWKASGRKVDSLPDDAFLKSIEIQSLCLSPQQSNSNTKQF